MRSPQLRLPEQLFPLSLFDLYHQGFAYLELESTNCPLAQTLSWLWTEMVADPLGISQKGGGGMEDLRTLKDSTQQWGSVFPAGLAYPTCCDKQELLPPAEEHGCCAVT